jgi:hypothetical protein
VAGAALFRSRIVPREGGPDPDMAKGKGGVNNAALDALEVLAGEDPPARSLETRLDSGSLESEGVIGR